MGTVVTNGYLLSGENVKKLLEHGVSIFQITIDGDEKIHDRQRKLPNGGKTFKKIHENLSNLLEIKGNFNVILRTNVSKSMLGIMYHYYSLMKSFFDDERFYAVFHPVVDFEDLSHEISDLELISEIKIAAENGFKFTPILEFLDYQSSFCYAIRENNYVIDSELNVSKCTVANDPYSIVGSVDLDGRLKSNKFEKLWTSARISDKCLKCENYSSCAGGACPLYYLKHGKARCMKFKSHKGHYEVLKLAEILNEEDIYIHV